MNVRYLGFLADKGPSCGAGPHLKLLKAVQKAVQMTLAGSVPTQSVVRCA